MLFPAFEQRCFALREFTDPPDLVDAESVGQQAFDVVERAAAVDLLRDAIEAIGDRLLARCMFPYPTAEFARALEQREDIAGQFLPGLAFPAEPVLEAAQSPRLEQATAKQRHAHGEQDCGRSEVQGLRHRRTTGKCEAGRCEAQPVARRGAAEAGTCQLRSSM